MLTLEQAQTCALQNLLPALSGSDYADLVAEDITQHIIDGNWATVWSELCRYDVHGSQDNPEMWRVSLVVDIALTAQKMLNTRN